MMRVPLWCALALVGLFCFGNVLAIALYLTAGGSVPYSLAGPLIRLAIGVVVFALLKRLDRKQPVEAPTPEH